MKVSREQAAANRERIVNTAAALFREKGFDGIGVADLMKEAGLTHGGFYGHFGSKEDLITEALERALEGSIEDWETWSKQDSKSALGGITRAYLSPRHRDRPQTGCLLATLSADAARQPGSVRDVVTRAVRALAGKLEPLMPHRLKAARQQKALATLASLVGAQMLARAVGDVDLSKEILQAVAVSIEADKSR